jgi:hypothetical protein
MSWQGGSVQKGGKRLARCLAQRAFLFPQHFLCLTGKIPAEVSGNRDTPLRLQVAFVRIKLQVARYAALRFPQTMPTIFEKEQWYV